MTIAVTGAFSYSGKYITRRLLERGEQVITLTNHPRRADPFDKKVRTFPLNFDNAKGLVETLKGVEVLVNTYWVRFDRRSNTQPQAVENTKILMHAAVQAGVQRVVHISITNPSINSPLPYFHGKAVNEQTVVQSGLNYAILRPTVLFGKEDILINNIAWILRRFPFFGLPGKGEYRLSPVYVDDLAEMVVDSIYSKSNFIRDAVGPEEFSFRQMVSLIGTAIGVRRALIPLPPRAALYCAQLIGLYMRDVVLTRHEVQGLMANLLVSGEPPRCKTGLSAWLTENRETLGKEYASELNRHYWYPNNFKLVGKRG
ncbi:MAG: NAD-dependent epimerase/dehydratase family protein [Chloroflexi bacterium]|nr:NAD-dependent epimerase/dehydratase family protein [Chloroflexota bacterium]